MFVLDTNVVSELRKIRLGRADARVAQWADSVETAHLYLSAITVQELEIGVLLAERRDPQQGAVFRTWLDSHVLPAFAGRILPVDTTVAQRSARLHVPDPRPVRDGLIAATALVHGMTVVTRNVLDFEPCGVPLLNPWDALWHHEWQSVLPEPVDELVVMDRQHLKSSRHRVPSDLLKSIIAGGTIEVCREFALQLPLMQ